MNIRVAAIAVATCAVFGLTVMAQQTPAPAGPPAGRAEAPAGRQGRAGGGRDPNAVPAIQGQNINGMHIYLRAGLKTHGEGQHDYPQFLADWSKLLTVKYGAVVDGSYHA